MFERLFRDIFVSQLKKFIEDFDESEGLQLDSWNGTITKHNLELKRDALQHIGPTANLGYPLQIAKGTVGRLHV